MAIAIALLVALGSTARGQPSPLAIPDHHTQGCDPYVIQHTTANWGWSAELASGWAASKDPVEGRVWSLGLQGRRRLSQHHGLFVRADHVRGRDAIEDANRDGVDDVATGSVRRTSAATGLSWIVWDSRGQARPFVQIDLGAGYLRAGNDEDGPIAMVDGTYALGPVRLGVRVQQGFLDATDAVTVVGHAGFGHGATPQYQYGGGCPGFEHNDRGRPFAIALDLPILGHGLSSNLRWSVPGFGITAALHAWPRIDPMIRGDLIGFPNGSRDRMLHQSLLAGARLDLSRSASAGARTGIFVVLLGGYTHATGPNLGDLGSGAIVDSAIGWGPQGSDGAAWLAVHGRLGLGPDNRDMRALFLSAGLELRFHRDRWSDRN
ncbi:MAG: hypothetical protein AB7L28_09665 [Kofleriaceae bacterium]